MLVPFVEAGAQSVSLSPRDATGGSAMSYCALKRTRERPVFVLLFGIGTLAETTWDTGGKYGKHRRRGAGPLCPSIAIKDERIELAALLYDQAGVQKVIDRLNAVKVLLPEHVAKQEPDTKEAAN
jgi:hypothetical protein